MENTFEKQEIKAQELLYRTQIQCLRRTQDLLSHLRAPDKGCFVLLKRVSVRGNPLLVDLASVTMHCYGAGRSMSMCMHDGIYHFYNRTQKSMINFIIKIN